MESQETSPAERSCSVDGLQPQCLGWGHPGSKSAQGNVSGVWHLFLVTPTVTRVKQAAVWLIPSVGLLMPLGLPLAKHHKHKHVTKSGERRVASSVPAAAENAGQVSLFGKSQLGWRRTSGDLESPKELPPSLLLGIFLTAGKGRDFHGVAPEVAREGAVYALMYLGYLSTGPSLSSSLHLI